MLNPNTINIVIIKSTLNSHSLYETRNTNSAIVINIVNITMNVPFFMFESFFNILISFALNIFMISNIPLAINILRIILKY